MFKLSYRTGMVVISGCQHLGGWGQSKLQSENVSKYYLKEPQHCRDIFLANCPTWEAQHEASLSEAQQQACITLQGLLGLCSGILLAEKPNQLFLLYCQRISDTAQLRPTQQFLDIIWKCPVGQLSSPVTWSAVYGTEVSANRGFLSVSLSANKVQS